MPRKEKMVAGRFEYAYEYECAYEGDGQACKMHD